MPAPDRGRLELHTEWPKLHPAIGVGGRGEARPFEVRLSGFANSERPTHGKMLRITSRRHRGIGVGQAHLFDATTGALLRTFDDPTPTSCDFSIAVLGTTWTFSSRRMEKPQENRPATMDRIPQCDCAADYTLP